MKKYTLYLIAIVILAGLGSMALSTGKYVAHADSNQNLLSGWAWSSNIGWLSFNGGDSGAGSTQSTYAVTLATTTANPTIGTLSGYAWSPNIGWVSFNPAVNNTPPDGSSGTTTVNMTTGAVTGWARALVGCQSDLWATTTLSPTIKVCTGSGPGKDNGVTASNIVGNPNAGFTVNWDTGPIFGQYNPGAAIPEGIASDGSYLYVGGIYESTYSQGYLEKRDIKTGTLIWSKYLPPTTTNGGSTITDMAVDSTGIYLAGFLNQNETSSNPDYIQKYDLNGSLLWQKTISITGIAADNGYMQVFLQGGYLYCIGPYTNSYMYVEERDPSTGNLIWSTKDASLEYGGPAIVNNNGVYTMGLKLNNNNNYYLERKSLTDGSLIWSVAIGVNVAMIPGVIGADSTGVYDLYIASGNSQGGQYTTYYEKRNLTDGSLIWSQAEPNFGTGPFAYNQSPLPATITSSALYDGVSSDANLYRLQKRDLSTGNIIASTTWQVMPTWAESMIASNNHIYTDFVNDSSQKTWEITDTIDNAVSSNSVGTNTGWDGWIELSGTNHSTGDSTGASGVTYASTTGSFVGYAWGGPVVGWLQFSPTLSNGTIAASTTCPTCVVVVPTTGLTLQVNDPISGWGGAAYVTADPSRNVSVPVKWIVSGVSNVTSLSNDWGISPGSAVDASGKSFNSSGSDTLSFSGITTQTVEQLSLKYFTGLVSHTLPYVTITITPYQSPTPSCAQPSNTYQCSTITGATGSATTHATQNQCVASGSTPACEFYCQQGYSLRGVNLCTKSSFQEI
jgi:hypothetical protein